MKRDDFEQLVTDSMKKRVTQDTTTDTESCEHFTCLPPKCLITLGKKGILTTIYEEKWERGWNWGGRTLYTLLTIPVIPAWEEPTL